MIWLYFLIYLFKGIKGKIISKVLLDIWYLMWYKYGMEFKKRKEQYHMYMQGILGTQRGNEIISTIENSKDSNVLDVYFGMTHFTSYRKDDSETKKILVLVW